MASGVALSDECLETYQDLQGSKKKYRYIIYKLNKDFSEIVVDSTKPRDEASAEEAYDEFCGKLIQAAANGEGRYGVFDVHYNVDTRELDKVVFFTWVSDTLPIKQKMLYASSAKALRGKMTGVHTEIQCNDESDLKLEGVIAKCRQKSYE